MKTTGNGIGKLRGIGNLFMSSVIVSIVGRFSSFLSRKLASGLFGSWMTGYERLGRAVEKLSELRDTCKAETAGRTKSIEAIFSLAGALAIILMF